MSGPAWIKVVIVDLLRDVERFRDSDGHVNFSALGRDEYKFRTALVTQNFNDSERARKAWEEASIAYSARISNGRKGGRPRKDAAQRDSRQSATNNADDPLPTGRPLGPAGGKACSSDGDSQGAASARLDGAFARPENSQSAITAGYHEKPTGAGASGSPAEAPAGASFQSGSAGRESAVTSLGGSPQGDGGNSYFHSTPVPTPAPTAKAVAAKPKTAAKRPHGSAGNVMLTDAESRKLTAEFGDIGQLIEELSDYLLNHPGKYRSHYAALRSWARRRRAEGRNMDGTRGDQNDRLAAYYDRRLAEAAEKDRLEAARKEEEELRKAEALAEARAILQGEYYDADDEY